MQTSSHIQLYGAEGVRRNSPRQTVELKCLHFGSGRKDNLNFIATLCRGRTGEGTGDEQPLFGLFIASQLDRSAEQTQGFQMRAVRLYRGRPRDSPCRD